MTAFRIWAKVQELAPDSYCATVVSFSEKAGEAEGEAETHLVSSPATGKLLCDHMINEFSLAIAERGDTVSGSEYV